jgi:hypothetical protein
MSKCDAEVYAYANVSLNVLVNEDGNVMVGQTTLTLPRTGLNSQDPAGAGLKNAGPDAVRTPSKQLGGAIDIDVPFVGHYTGHMITQLDLEFSARMYADCDGPYCVRCDVTDIEAQVLYEYPTKLRDVDLRDDTIQFPDQRSSHTTCKAPEWELCCPPQQKQLEFKLLDKHALVPGKLLLTISGKATATYEIWRRTSGRGQSSAADFGKAETRPDGTMKFALASGTINSKVPLPASLGGGVVIVTEATGYVVCRPGRARDHWYPLEILELAYETPSIKLPDGRETGPNRVMLDPEQPATGEVDLHTGALTLNVPQLISNALFREQPIRVSSRIAGFYDAVHGVAHIVTYAFDEFPDVALERPKAK